MPITVSKILLYPIKSLPPLEVTHAEVLASGALKHDRQFAFVDSAGNFLNGKRNAKVHQLRATFDIEEFSVELSADGRVPQRFSLRDDHEGISAWASEFFRQEVTLVEETERGFPDDMQANGPTLVSEGTLQRVASWFPSISVAETALRFRTNLELSTPEPFWEDQLTGSEPVQFRVGDVSLLGTGICQRCVVPSRNPHTGEAIPRFGKQFMEHRQTELPAWSPKERFDHFFRLTINTRLAPTCPGGIIEQGSVVELK